MKSLSAVHLSPPADFIMWGGKGHEEAGVRWYESWAKSQKSGAERQESGGIIHDLSCKSQEE